MDPLARTGHIPNGFGCTGSPLSRPARRHVSGGVLRGGWAVSVTPAGAWSGLGGPMPHTITLVGWGRCRPTPDRVSEGASPDRDAGGIVTGHLSARGGQRFPPVLTTPPGGVRGIDGDDGETVFGGHRDESRFELAGGHPGNDLPEPLPAAVLLPGLLGGEVEVLDRNGLDPGVPRPAQQPGEGVPDLGVTVACRSAQVVGESVSASSRSAVRTSVHRTTPANRPHGTSDRRLWETHPAPPPTPCDSYS